MCAVRIAGVRLLAGLFVVLAIASHAGAACNAPPSIAIDFTGPDDGGNGEMVITYAFPGSTNPNERLIGYTVFWPGDFVGNSFRPAEASGVAHLPWSLSCRPAATYTFKAEADCTGAPHREAFDTYTYAGANPTIDLEYIGPDAFGHGTMSVHYSFPYTSSPSQRQIELLQEPQNGIAALNPEQREGTWTFPYDYTCRSGTFWLRAIGRHCNGVTVIDRQAVLADTKPTVSLSLSAPDDNGDVTGTVTYNFPNTDSPDDRSVSRVIRFGNQVNLAPAFHPPAQSGTWQFTYNLACWGPDPVSFTAYAQSCSGEQVSSEVVVTPQHEPAVSIQIDPADPQKALVTYSFTGTGSPSQRTLRVQWPDGTAIGEVHPTTAHGQTTFDLPACHVADTIKAIATACGDRQAVAQTEATGREPIVRVTSRKGEIDPQTGRRKIIGFVGWDMRPGTANWRVKIDLEKWTHADGTTTNGANILDFTPETQAGTRNFSIVPPKDAQQYSILATAQSCAGASYANTSGECDACNGAASGNPVDFSDGDVRVADTDPLPAIAGRALARTYNSDEQLVALFGRGWTTLFDRRLIVNTVGTDNDVSVLTESNEVVTFRGAGTTFRQVWPTARRSLGTLMYDAQTNTYLFRSAGSTDAAIFNAATGRLLALRDLATGHDAQVTYDLQGLPQSLTDGWNGVRWNLTIDAQKRVVSSISVSTRPDLVWTYSYDPNGNLIAVRAPGNADWRTYGYTSNRMTASRDALGHLIESHTFDANGYGISSTGSVDEIASIQYNLPSSSSNERVTRVTEKNGAVTDYVLAPAGGAYRPVRVKGGCASCGMRDRTFVYDERGHILREQSPDGYVDVTNYSGEHVTSEQRRLQPSGCDPQTDSDHCRMESDALAAAALVSTPSSYTSTFEYGDPLWPERVTRILRPSIGFPSDSIEERLTYHSTSGNVVARSVRGWAGEEPSPSERSTSTTFYGDDAPAGGEESDRDGEGGAPNAPAFDPGGTFNAAWLTLAQPSLLAKTNIGPREQQTQFVYYPIHESVPAELRGRLAATKNAAGHVVRYEEYDVFGNPARIVDANGVVTEMSYDILGRLLTMTTKGIAGCDTSRDVLCATDLVEARTYSTPAGPLQTQQRPGGGVTSYAYDDRGRIQAVSRGPSATDLRERMETSYEATTGQKSLERLLALESGSWVEKSRESFAYDLNRQLQTVTHADGSTVGYSYDSSFRLASVRDENHASANTFYSYDPAGQLMTVRQTLSSVAGGSISTQYVYDIYGNLRSVTDPNGNLTQYTYDDFGQLAKQTSPVTGVTRYEYDEGGNLTLTIDANGMMTRRTYDLLNRVIAATSSKLSGEAPPPGRDEDPPPPFSSPSETVTWTYDDPAAGGFAIGRVSSMADPLSTTAYDYDRRGLLIRESRSITTCLITRDSGVPCPPNRMDVTAYAYDRDGNRSTIRYPSGQLIVNYTFDYAGRPLTASGVVTAATYLPFGPLSKLELANGTTETFAYDTRYRMTDNDLSRTGVPGQPGLIAGYRYEYDKAGNIVKLQDKQDPDDYLRRFTYDDLNRLLTANTKADTPNHPSPLWGKGEYTWDAMRNVLRASIAEFEPPQDGGGGELLAPTNPKFFRPPNKPRKKDTSAVIVKPLGRVMELAYEGTTPRVAAITLNDLSRPVTEDGAGNEVSYVVTRTYSPRNLLEEVTDSIDPGAEFIHRLRYGYDGRGLRIARAESPSNGAGTVSRRFHVYSPELQLLSVTREDNINVWGGNPPTALANNVDSELVWFGSRPVAQVETTTPEGLPSGARRYTFADHLGTPWLQTNSTGAIIWRVEYEPFGSIYEVREGIRTDQPLRFPGQELAMTWEGAEESYNIFRWYKAGWGRYTQADPISLAGGMNLYSYAFRNPITNMDPFGLVTWTQNAPVYHGANWDTVFKNCGSWSAHGCAISYATGWCNCVCEEGSFRAKVKLTMSPVVWARNDDPLAPLTQILFEETKHVQYYKVMFKWAIKRGEQLEAKEFSNKKDCDAACQNYLDVTKKDFISDWVHENNPHPF
jgi:RHS repeat-associated protein